MTVTGPSKPLFDVVEIEVNSRCNRSCHYCPVSVLPVSGQARMSRTVFTVLIDNLGDAR